MQEEMKQPVPAQGIDHTKLADGEREAFEAWNGGIYRGYQADIAWAAWRARGQQAGVPEVLPLYSTRLAAARYRFIRENSYVEVVCNSPRAEGWSPSVLDATIDRAIAAAAAPGEAG